VDVNVANLAALDFCIVAALVVVMNVLDAIKFQLLIKTLN